MDLEQVTVDEHFQEARVAPAVVDEGAGTGHHDAASRIGNLPDIRSMDMTVEHEIDSQVAQQCEHVPGTRDKIAFPQLAPRNRQQPVVQCEDPERFRRLAQSPSRPGQALVGQLRRGGDSNGNDPLMGDSRLRRSEASHPATIGVGVGLGLVLETQG